MSDLNLETSPRSYWGGKGKRLAEVLHVIDEANLVDRGSLIALEGIFTAGYESSLVQIRRMWSKGFVENLLPSCHQTS